MPNAECETKLIGNRNDEHKQMMSGVIRGRGANGAPKFSWDGSGNDVPWPVQMHRRVSVLPLENASQAMTQ